MKIDYYYKRISSDAKALKDNFTWTGKATKMAVKTGIASVIAVMISYALEFEHAYWSAITCMIMMQPSVAATLKKGLIRSSATIVGVLLGLFLFGLFQQNHIMCSAAIIIFLTFCLYMRMNSKNIGYFWYLMGITFVMVLTLGVGSDQPDAVVHIAFYRGLEIIIGVIVSIIVNIYIWPEYALDALGKEFTKLREESLKFVQKTIEAYLSCGKTGGVKNEDYNNLKTEIGKCRKLVEEAKLESRPRRGLAGYIDTEIYRIEMFIEKTWEFFNSISGSFSHLHYQKEYTSLFNDILKSFEKLLKLGFGGKKLSTRSTLYRVDLDLKKIEDLYSYNLATKKYYDYKVSDTIQFLEAVYIIKDVFYAIKLHLFYRYHKFEPSNENYNVPKSITEDRSDFIEFDFLFKHWSINWPMLKYALKASITLVIVIWLWKLFEIPGGGITMSMAVILVIQPDLMTTHIKGFLRFFGCTVGMIIGFAALGLQVESTWMMCLIIFTVISFAAYVYTGGPGIAYAGLQIGLAFILAFIPQSHPATELQVVVERFVGIFFGVVCAWTISLFLWPEDLLSHFRKQVYKIQNALSKSKMLFNEIEKDPECKLTFKSIDFNSIISALNTLKGQGEIDGSKANTYFSWIEQQRRIFWIIEGLFSYREILLFLSNLNHTLFEEIFDLIEKLPECNPGDQEIEDKVNVIKNEVKSLLIIIRAGAIRDREYSFKLECSHMIIALKGLANRLDKVVELQAEMDL